MPSHVKAAAPRVKGTMTFKAKNDRGVGSGSRTIPKRPSLPSDNDEDEDGDEDDERSEDEADAESEADTDDELAAAQNGKSKKTAKRKRRATSPSTFGATLQGLLGTSEIGQERSTQQKGQPAILSLAPHVRRSAQSSRLNEKASRLAVEAKKKRLERARVKDVITGWGAPGQLPKMAEGIDDGDENEKLNEWQLQGGSQAYEKKLRKVAQRGVVKLFNAIRAAQNTTTDDVEIVKGTSKEERGFKTAASNTLKGDNILGGKAKAVTELSKNNFFDLIRSGSKATAAH